MTRFLAWLIALSLLGLVGVSPAAARRPAANGQAPAPSGCRSIGNNTLACIGATSCPSGYDLLNNPAEGAALCQEAGASTAPSACPAPQTVSPGGGQTRSILYLDVACSGADDYSLAAISPDGAMAGAPLDGLVAAGSPAWSPDGSRYAYVTYKPDAIQIADPGAQAATVYIASDGKKLVSWLAWAPDSRRLAFLTLTPPAGGGGPYGAQLTILDVTTGAVLLSVQIGPDVVHLPYFFKPLNKFEWAPDGAHILLSWESAIVVDAQQGSVEVISPSFAVAEWAPDSAGVYYFLAANPTAPAERGMGALFVKPLGAGPPVLLMDADDVARAGLSAAPLVYGEMSLSPSGRTMAVVSGSDQPGTTRILLYDLGSGARLEPDQPEQVAETNDVVVQIAWAPDESNLAALTWGTGDSPLQIKTFALQSGTWSTLVALRMRESDAQRLDLGDGVASIKMLSWAA